MLYEESSSSNKQFFSPQIPSPLQLIQLDKLSNTIRFYAFGKPSSLKKIITCYNNSEKYGYPMRTKFISNTVKFWSIHGRPWRGARGAAALGPQIVGAPRAPSPFWCNLGPSASRRESEQKERKSEDAIE